jgi:hypothetical protein
MNVIDVAVVVVVVWGEGRTTITGEQGPRWELREAAPKATTSSTGGCFIARPKRERS